MDSSVFDFPPFKERIVTQCITFSTEEYEQQPPPADVDGLVLDSVLIPQVLAGADTAQVVQEVQEDEANGVGRQHEGDMNMYVARAAALRGGVARNKQACDEHCQGLQIGAIHSCCSCSDGNEGALHGGVIGEEGESWTKIWRAYFPLRQVSPGAGARCGGQRAAASSGAGVLVDPQVARAT
eukprot:5237223-Pleurochrysis_carterae.AAC.2